jgi:hypothetical protein
MAVLRQSWSAASLGEAYRFADEAIPLLRRCGNPRGIVEVAIAVVGRALDERDYAAAAEAAEEGLRAAEEAGEPFLLSFALGNLALPALFMMQMDVAEPLFHEQMEVRRRERIELLWAEPALGLACIAAHAGDHHRAATLMGAYGALAALPVAPADQEIEDRLIDMFIAPARATLGERAWTRAAAAGAAMTPEQLCDFALRSRLAAEAVAPGDREHRPTAS